MAPGPAPRAALGGGTRAEPGRTASAAPAPAPGGARASQPSAVVPSVAVTGLVLCGGRSTRMGSDKAELELAGRTLIEHALAALAPLAASTRLASGTASRYTELARECCFDRVADGGPLAGIEAGLRAAPAGYVCVLAVDMPRAGATVFARMLQRAQREDLDACLLQSPSGPEPLCGVYHTRLGARLALLLDRGERKVTSFLSVALDGFPPVRSAWHQEVELADVATNLNTPGDLDSERARRSAAEHAAPRKAAP